MTDGRGSLTDGDRFFVVLELDGTVDGAVLNPRAKALDDAVPPNPKLGLDCTVGGADEVCCCAIYLCHDASCISRRDGLLLFVAMPTSTCSCIQILYMM